MVDNGDGGRLGVAIVGLFQLLDGLRARGEQLESFSHRSEGDSHSWDVRLASVSSERSYGATEQRSMSNPAGLGAVLTVGETKERDILAEPDGPFANVAQDGEVTGPNLTPGTGTLADVQAGGDE